MLVREPSYNILRCYSTFFFATLLGVFSLSTSQAQIALASSIYDSGNPNALSVTNQTAKPWLGISMANVAEVDPLYAQELGLNKSMGVMVTEVKPGSPAEKAGLLPPELSTYLTNQTVKVLDSDVILELDNLNVQNVPDISSAIQTKKMGDSLTLTVLRNGQVREVTVTPTPKPDFLVFQDPGLLYTIMYPSNWTVVQPEQLPTAHATIRKITRANTARDSTSKQQPRLLNQQVLEQVFLS